MIKILSAPILPRAGWTLFLGGIGAGLAAVALASSPLIGGAGAPARASRPEDLVTLLFTVNNFGYTDTCG